METLMDLGQKIISIFEAVAGMDFTSEIIPMLIMWAIGGTLIYLAIVCILNYFVKKLEKRLAKSDH